jgi:hypothetical protein
MRLIVDLLRLVIASSHIRRVVRDFSSLVVPRDDTGRILDSTVAVVDEVHLAR